VDVSQVRQVSHGAASHSSTGSRDNKVAVHRRAVHHGHKVNEYGVYKDDKRIAGRTEKEVYRQLGLAYIRPELREDRGEIEAAHRGRLPEPVGTDDLRGDLHCHTSASDGRHSLKQMAATAARLGYEYLAVTDHSQRLRAANGLNEKRLFEQIKAIDAFNERSNDIVILKSIEVDILEDGSLDLPDSVLQELDFTVCSIHHKLNLSQKQQTERIIRAMDNRYFTILGHPTGRVINERPPCAVDIETVLQAAADRNRFIEINARPKRLDLTDEGCLLARRLGVKLSIASDAHSADSLGRIRYGVNQARRGWLEAGDIINTRGLAELRQLFYKPR
jgi:DNA polymerase (family 10)